MKKHNEIETKYFSIIELPEKYMCKELVSIENEKLLEMKTISEWLKVSPSTIRTWIKQRKISYVKIGSKVLFRHIDIEEFVIGSPLENIYY